MDKLYWGAVAIFAIGWYIEQRMYVDGYTRRKRDLYKPIDYLGLFSIGEFVGYLIRSLGFLTSFLGCQTTLFKLLQPCGWL